MRNSLKIILCFGILGSSVFSSFGQTTSNSPYSIYGLGDPNSRSFAQHRSMGGAQIAASNPLYINSANPAAYGVLSQPTFNVDLNIDFLSMSSPSTSVKTSNMYLNDISFGFQLGKRAGVAFTLSPYTKIGYNIQAQENNTEVGNVSYLYTGEGGINNFLFGVGFSPILKKNTALLVGVNGTYYFGFAETSRSVANFVDQPTHLNSGIVNRTSLNDLSIDLGVIFKQRLNQNTRVSIGATYTPSLNLKAANEQFSYSYTFVNSSQRIRDTVNYVTNSGRITMPSFLGLGLSLELGKKWAINGDLKIQDWSQLNIFGAPQNLNTRIETAIGAELLPNGEAMAKYLQAIRYRFGLRTVQSRLNINSEQLSEMGGSFGIGLPILKAKSQSTLNIGMEFGQRTGTAQNLVNENFTYLFIGVSFNPHKFDTWFKRRKYD